MTGDGTIAAIATPAGRGGLGMVRLSGPEARRIAQTMLGRELAPRQACFARFRDDSGAVLDDVVAVLFPAPRSATAEDVVEITAHGAPVLLAALVQAAVALGARPAEPGEFTRRAFLNGRLDLTQAEAIGDLIAAQTLLQARTAAQQMRGSVSRLLEPAHERLVRVIARLEAGIDFAEDDVSVPADDAVAADIQAVHQELGRLEAGFARPLREGLSVALLGPPNVGKSSLFNRLLERERAIVTAQPGTTRDLIESGMDWDGIPVRLVDTAGIRKPEVEAERLGIERSWEAAADADIVLAVFDASAPSQPEDERLRARVAELPRALTVWNKVDLTPAAGWRLSPNEIAVSALRGDGIADLRARLRRDALSEAAGEGGGITNLRQVTLVRAAISRLATALAEAGSVPHEVLLVTLYAALEHLDSITGQTTVEDILGVIFSTFCIGK